MLRKANLLRPSQKMNENSIQIMVFNKLERITQSKHFLVKFCAFATIFTAIFYFPDYSNIDKDIFLGIDRQIEAPFEIYQGEDEHWSQRQFRLAIPLFAGLVNIKGLGIYVLQVMALIPFLLLSFRLTLRITHDSVSAMLLTLSLAVMYVGKSFLVVASYYDAFAFLFLVCSMYFRHAIPVFIFVFLACFTDERAAVASFSLLFWYSLPKNEEEFKFRDVWKISSIKIAVVVAWIAWLGARLLLSEKFGFTSSIGQNTGLGGSIFQDNLNLVPLVTVFSLEGLWVIMAIYFVYAFGRSTLSLISMVAMILFCLLPIFLVIDMSRSAAYLFILIFVCLEQLKLWGWHKQMMRNSLLLGFTVSLLLPTYIVYGGIQQIVHWMKPLSAVVIKYLFL